MNLKTYIRARPGNATALAEALGIKPSYLSQMASGGRTVSPARAAQIEQITGGKVGRRDLRDDWRDIWPEIAKRA